MVQGANPSMLSFLGGGEEDTIQPKAASELSHYLLK